MAQPTAAANLFTAEVFFIFSVFFIVSVYFVPSVSMRPQRSLAGRSTCMAVRSPRFCSQASWFPTLAWRSTELWFLATRLASFAPPASGLPSLAVRSPRVLLSGILVPDPGRAVRWPVALAVALCHIQKTTSQVFWGRKDSEYLLIVSTSGYIYVRIVWLIPGGQAPVMPAGQAPVMPAGQTWRFFQIANTP